MGQNRLLKPGGFTQLRITNCIITTSQFVIRNSYNPQFSSCA